mmetsp:Transcript_32438/g.75672  ORF Transcript_32438/g.75672 Transcript_32438/m.75672 type:complete len:81 (-) Transcript_32438:637-879(-)
MRRHVCGMQRRASVPRRPQRRADALMSSLHMAVLQNAWQRQMQGKRQQLREELAGSLLSDGRLGEGTIAHARSSRSGVGA